MTKDEGCRGTAACDACILLDTLVTIGGSCARHSDRVCLYAALALSKRIQRCQSTASTMVYANCSRPFQFNESIVLLCQSGVFGHAGTHVLVPPSLGPRYREYPSTHGLISYTSRAQIKPLLICNSLEPASHLSDDQRQSQSVGPCGDRMLQRFPCLAVLARG
jgi:hypothetical protein